MMNPKENYLAVWNGQKPDYVPLAHEATQFVGMIPASMLEGVLGDTVDGFGVPWVKGLEGPMVKPGYIMFEEIEDWREHIKVPDLKAIDWAGFAAMEEPNLDRENKASVLFVGGGIFLRMVHCMGFENALMAMALDPDECKELFKVLTDYVIEYISLAVEAYKPDLVLYFDDIATGTSLFMSEEMYRDQIKPFHKQIVAHVNSLGLPFQMHTCGKCESVMDDYVEIGVRGWHAAQPMNDIAGLLKKYEGRFVIQGGWDTQGPASYNTSTVEEVLEEARRCMDTYGRLPGFVLEPSLINERGHSLFVGDIRLTAIEEEWKKISIL